MGDSGGMFGTSKQKAAGAFKVGRDAKAGESEAIARQRAIARGEAPSIAQGQFAASLDAQNRQAMSFAASQRGVSNPALAFRQAQIGNQQMGLEAAQQAGLMRMQEQRAADGFLQQTASGQRGIALNSALANQQADAQKSASDRAMLGNLGGAAIALSDENTKTNIKHSENGSTKVISEFMDALKSYTYEYKKGSTQPNGKPKPEGEVRSVMAQDLEKSDLGKQMVTDTPDGKVVDYAQGMAPLFAAIAELNKRTKHLGKGK